jgi:transposase-like protein
MKKRFTDEQIISILREAESKELATVDLCKRHNITEQTFYRWRNKFGGMDVSDARRLRELESENDKLKRMVAEQLLVIDGLKELSRKNDDLCGPARSAGSPYSSGAVATQGMSLSGSEPADSGLSVATTRKGSEPDAAAHRGVARGPSIRLSAYVCLAGLGRVPSATLERAQTRHPRKRPRRGRCGNDIRLPGATKPNSVWSYDFVHDQMVDGRSLKMLCVIDEYTRECLAIEVAANLRSQDVILTLSRLMRLHGKPAYVRSDNGVEFTAAKVMRWLRDASVGPAFIAPGSPWQNGFVESFNGKTA